MQYIQYNIYDNIKQHIYMAKVLVLLENRYSWRENRYLWRETLSSKFVSFG